MISVRTFIIYIATAALLCISMQRCTGNKRAVTSQKEDVFSSGEASRNVCFSLFNFSEDSCRIYIKTDTRNLLYANYSGSETKAELQIDFTIKSVGAAEPFRFSKTVLVSDLDDEKLPKTLLSSTAIHAPAGREYTIEAMATDLNKQRSLNTTLKLNRKDTITKSDFFFFQGSALNPVFNDRIKPNEEYTVKINGAIDKPINVYYYDREFPLPPPPFAIYDPDRFDYTSDSTFTLVPDSSNTARFYSAETGFYSFQIDSINLIGATLFISPDEFPKVRNVKNMIDPFRYLVGGKDYRDILTAENQKAFLESFWIDWAGSKDRARKSINAYYGRVELANSLFSSHVEGWKSDRGIIYIIYGKPNKIYQTEVAETWIYGEENNPLSITFHFLKVINPFTLNDYRLNREEFYKPSWYRSVNAWRDGRIY